jgi:hypothetical protein
VFILSDFLATDYELALKRLARRHEVVAILVGDEKERSIPPVGQFLFLDPETGEEKMVDASSYAFKKWMKEYFAAQDTDLATTLKGGKVELLRLTTQEDYGETVVRFFRARQRRKR